MKTTYPLAVYLVFAMFASTQAITCITCEDCSNVNVQMINKTCSSGEDACMKLDFNKYVAKKCGTYSSTCTKDGFKSGMSNLWDKIKTAVGPTEADSELNLNVNMYGRNVLNCCQSNYCNNGSRNFLSIVAFFGMALAFAAAK